jgi:hypothetical protein
LGGRDWEDHGFTPVLAKNPQKFILTNHSSFVESINRKFAVQYRPGIKARFYSNYKEKQKGLRAWLKWYSA